MTDPIARTSKQVGAAIRRRRRALGMNQKQVGKKTHLRQATISGLEAGEDGTQLRTLFGVLTALNMELVIRPRTKSSTDKMEEMF
jgi:HTH-type transcriptional regulator/antitoxin HipB